MAFYSLISIAPLMVIAVAVAGSVFDADAVRAHLLDNMAVVLDPRTVTLVSELLERPWYVRTGPVGGVLAALTLILASTAAFAQLRTSLNRIWEVSESGDTVRDAVRGRVLSFALVLATGVMVVLSLLLRAGLSAFGSLLEPRLPFDFGLFRAIDLVFFLSVLTTLFTLVFRYVPDRRIPWRHLWVGASITSLLFLMGELAIGFYLGTVSPASASGAVGSVGVLALWVYYSCMVFFWGAELTCVYAARRAQPALRSAEGG
jgi:membrane protein